jgi:hypothetical protein
LPGTLLRGAASGAPHVPRMPRFFAGRELRNNACVLQPRSIDNALALAPGDQANDAASRRMDVRLERLTRSDYMDRGRRRLVLIVGCRIVAKNGATRRIPTSESTKSILLTRERPVERLTVEKKLRSTIPDAVRTSTPPALFGTT